MSDQRVDVASKLSGYIREILVPEGDRMQRGQVLARLNATDVEGTCRVTLVRYSGNQINLTTLRTSAPFGHWLFRITGNFRSPRID